MSSSSPTPAPLDGRWVRLIPLTPALYDFVFSLAIDEELAHRWRYRGFTPGPEQFARALWENVFAQFVIVSNKTAEPLGTIIGYNLQTRDRYAYFAMMLAKEHQHAGWPLEGAELFFDYVFQNWDLRKVYAETLEYNLAQFRSAVTEIFDVEGTLRCHEYFDGQYWDMHILALHRDRWFGRQTPHALP